MMRHRQACGPRVGRKLNYWLSTKRPNPVMKVPETRL
jgi:hypothetical protein